MNTGTDLEMRNEEKKKRKPAPDLKRTVVIILDEE